MVFSAVLQFYTLHRQSKKRQFYKLALALKPSGIGYVSFKLGTRARLDRGRYFYDMDEERLRYIIAETPINLTVVSHYTRPLPRPRDC